MENTSLEDQIAEARGLPAGEAKIETLERLVDLADSLGDLDTAFDVRDDLTEAAIEWGRLDKQLVAFTWCLAQFDRDPERFADWNHKLLWIYKRVLGTIAVFPTLSLAQCEAMFSDFRHRLERGGLSLSTFDDYAFRHALQLGDRALLMERFERFKRHKRLSSLDCRACWMHFEVLYHLQIGDDETALRVAETLFQPRAVTCHLFPKLTRAVILEPLLRLGRVQEAAEHHRNGYRAIASSKGYVAYFGFHLAHLGYISDLKKALKLFEKHLGWVYENNNLAHRFAFLRGALPMLHQLKATHSEVKLRLSTDFPHFEASGVYKTVALEGVILAELRRIAALFDARNGNDFYGQRIGVDEALFHSIAIAEDASKSPPRKSKKRKT
jgi:hypothetical protein